MSHEPEKPVGKKAGSPKAASLSDTIPMPRGGFTRNQAKRHPAGALLDDAPSEAKKLEGAPRAGQVSNETQAFDPGLLVPDVSQATTSAAKVPVIGDYKLLKKLGQGGMGTVFKAHQISLDREVAVKVLAKELASRPDFVQRFLREARVMAKLDHPNIVRCHEVGEAMGRHYLSMEFVEGGSMADWLKKLGTIPLGDALYTAITVARALAYAHEQGLIHRDIKPDNILLTKKGILKVADLGLAKATDDDLGLTKTGTGAGTPIYMAPEQARDVKRVDGRCDIYALGVMLYVFLTGQAPFEGTTLVEVVEAKEKGKFKPIRSFNAEVPERVDLIVDKMLAKDVKHRYAACSDVVAELEALGLANERLSFFGPAGGAVAAKSAPTKLPASASKTVQPMSPAVTAVAKVSATTAPAFQDPKPDPNLWYWKLNDPAGRTMTKKVTTDEITTLIKSGSIDAKAQISKTQQGGYRAVGACGEFEVYFRGKIAQKRAGRGAEQFKNVLQQIEQEEARRQRWKSLKALIAKLGSGVGLIVWLAVVAGAVVGGYFAVTWILEKMR
jgi:serine/threonine protein kinase